jgi:hypothetical protein
MESTDCSGSALSAVSATMRARMPRAHYLKARTKLQAQSRLAVYHRVCNCKHCGEWVLKVNMPGPSMKVWRVQNMLGQSNGPILLQ